MWKAKNASEEALSPALRDLAPGASDWQKANNDPQAGAIRAPGWVFNPGFSVPNNQKVEAVQDFVTAVGCFTRSA